MLRGLGEPGRDAVRRRCRARRRASARRARSVDARRVRPQRRRPAAARRSSRDGGDVDRRRRRGHRLRARRRRRRTAASTRRRCCSTRGRSRCWFPPGHDRALAPAARASTTPAAARWPSPGRRRRPRPPRRVDAAARASTRPHVRRLHPPRRRRRARHVRARSSAELPRLRRARRHGDRAAARPPERPAGGQLLGLHAARLRRRRSASTRPATTPPPSWPTSSPPPTTTTSRSGSTSSSTTRPRSTPPGRRTACAGSTTRRSTGCDDDGSYIETTGCGNDLDVTSPVAQDLVRVVARSLRRPRRRRLPLRPRRRARPRPRLRRAARRRGPRAGACVLIAEPWDAVGRYLLGPGLAGRRAGCMERPLPRGRPRVPARRGRARRRRCSSACRAAPTSFDAPLRERQLPRLPRRLHALRPRRLRPQAQRGQRVERHRTGRATNRSWNCGWEGDDGAPADVLAAAPAPAAQRVVPAGDVPRHADGGDGRRVRADPGRQQQRLQPGQRDVVGRLGRAPPAFADLERFVAELARLRHRHPVLSQPEFWRDAVRFFGADGPARRRRPRRGRWRGRSATSTSSPTRGGSRCVRRPGAPVRGAASSTRRCPRPTTSSPVGVAVAGAAYDVAARSSSCSNAPRTPDGPLAPRGPVSDSTSAATGGTTKTPSRSSIQVAPAGRDVGELGIGRHEAVLDGLGGERRARRTRSAHMPPHHARPAASANVQFELVTVTSLNPPARDPGRRGGAPASASARLRVVDARRYSSSQRSRRRVGRRPEDAA